jgi:tetratricopeptide (TPR) repeat protein
MLAARPNSAVAWSDLGVLLLERGRMKEAEAARLKAFALKPDNPWFYAYHGGPLREIASDELAEQAVRTGIREAEQAVRTAIRLQSNYSMSYSFFANTLLLQKRSAEAEAACHTVIRLEPWQPWPYAYLAQIARARRQTDEAEALEHQAEQLQPDSVSKFRIRPAERVALLESKLPEWLRGKARPADALELTILGYMAAHRQGSYDAAAQLFDKSFKEQPTFAEATVEFPADRPRYFAACCAAQAGRGLGDGAFLKPEVQGQRQRQALEWLRQELAYWDKQMVDRRPAAQIRAYRALSYWQEDGWLAGVRDVGITDKLPLTEKGACRRLWEERAELLKRASAGLDETDRGGPGR